MVIALLRAGLFVMQPRNEVVSSQFTWSLFKGMYENEGESVPELMPLTFHWKKGDVPPLTGNAVNWTRVPWQTVIAVEVMDIETPEFGLTVSVTVSLE
jgi:hypothetical protein